MYLARLQRLKATLATAHLECAAAIAGPNLYYLTGLSFHLSERPTVGFFPRDGDPVIVAGSLEEAKIKNGAPYGVRSFVYGDADGPAQAFMQAAQALKLNKARLGVEARRMRVMELDYIEEALPGVAAEPAEDLFAALRMTKDADEIKAMREAVVIAEKALAATLPQIKVGLTEREVAAELVVQTLRAGSDADLPFAPIVASGPNPALPHATVTDRALQKGDLLTLDWGAATRRYFSTRPMRLMTAIRASDGCEDRIASGNRLIVPLPAVRAARAPRRARGRVPGCLRCRPGCRWPSCTRSPPWP